MKPIWDVPRNRESLTLPEWELVKTPEMQYRRELTLLYQESAFQSRVPLYGVLSTDALTNKEDVEEVTSILPDAKAAILIGAPIEDPWLRLWHRVPGISMKNFTTLITSKVEVMLLTIADKLEQQGFKAIIKQMPLTPSNEFLRLFELAGCGFIGKNHLVITEYYGCRVNLGAIVTDAPLLHGDYRYKPYNKNLCNDCNLCEEYCPCGALNDGFYDHEKCEAYINNPDYQLSFSPHTILKCDMCMRICPIQTVGKWDSTPVKWTKILQEKKINY